MSVALRRTEAAPIKCDGRESAGSLALAVRESIGLPALSIGESVGLPTDSLPAVFIGAASVGSAGVSELSLKS